jgi:hypothetical protein
LIGLIDKDLERYGPAAAYQEALRRGMAGQNLATVCKERTECLVKQAKFTEALAVLEQLEPLPDDAAVPRPTNKNACWTKPKRTCRKSRS